jgi:hypothetical protein
VKAQQDQAQQILADPATRFGICETPGVQPGDNLPPGAIASLAKLPTGEEQAAKSQILAGLQRACDQSMQGLQLTYRITFYGAVIALILGVFLPGWPGKWGGRGSTQTPIPGGH